MTDSTKFVAYPIHGNKVEAVDLARTEHRSSNNLLDLLMRAKLSFNDKQAVKTTAVDYPDLDERDLSQDPLIPYIFQYKGGKNMNMKIRKSLQERCINALGSTTNRSLNKKTIKKTKDKRRLRKEVSRRKLP